MKQKKNRYIWMICVVLVALSASVFSGCGREKNKFVVGFDAEFPPYGYKAENGEYVGYDLDLAQEVCDRNNWTLVKQPINWDSKDMELETGNIDCIWNGFTLNGREKLYTWSKAYIDNSQVVIVRKDSDINELSDLSGKIVIVQADSSALAAFTGEEAEEKNKELCASFKELQQVGDYNSAFLNLEAGAVDAICMDIGVANFQIEKRGNQFRLLSEQVSSEQYGIGFCLGNTELRNQVQETLDEMLADGTYAKITENWGLTDCACLGKPGTDGAYQLDAVSKEKVPFFEHFVSITKQLAKGMIPTLLIFFLTILFSMPLGLLVCMIRRSRFKVLQWLARIYISILRGTPLMLQLLVVFFGPHLLFGVNTPTGYRFYAVIIGFSLNYAAYFAEIYRAGIESIPAGQYEAANVLGYTKLQTFWKIIFPQMAKRVIPPVTNEIITLVKDTSLAFALAYTEMFTLAKQIVSAEASLIPLFVAGLFYYIFNFVVAMVMEKIEKKMSYYR